jgi:hypothetical protein
MSTLRLWLRFLVWTRASIRIAFRVIMSSIPALLTFQQWGDSIPTGMTVLVCMAIAFIAARLVWVVAASRSAEIKGLTKSEISAFKAGDAR